MSPQVAPSSQFGLELEFFLINSEGRPALGAGQLIINKARRAGLRVVPELGSFQLELNPGPWPLSTAGIQAALLSIQRDVIILEGIAHEHGVQLSTLALLPLICGQDLSSDAFFTSAPRYKASAEHFACRSAILRFADGSNMVLPGEAAIACINEIHVHVQLESDQATLALFAALNAAGIDLARKFLGQHMVNGKRLCDDCSTMSLFADANGEFDRLGETRRVCFLAPSVVSYIDYWNLARNFTSIVCDDGSMLDLESTVFFWVRLRGRPGDLRVEYRPMEMCSDWMERIRMFMEHCPWPIT